MSVSGSGLDRVGVIVTHFASTPERDELLRCCLEALDRMRVRGPLAVCLVSGTPVPPDLAARADACVFLANNPGHVEGESRLVRRGLAVAGWSGAEWVLKLASDCVVLDEELPWRWIARARARGKRLVTCKWGDNRSLGTLAFVGERSYLDEHFPDMEARPRPGILLERAFFDALRSRLDDVLLLHSYDLDFLRVRDRLGLHCHSIDAMRAFLRDGALPPGAPAVWFVPHEDRWEGVERALCGPFADDPRAGRPPARPLRPLRARLVEARAAHGAVGVGGDLGYEDERVVVAREPFTAAVSAHAPSRVVLEVEVDRPEGQVVHLGLALNDDVYPELQPGDHPMFSGRVEDASGRTLVDLGPVGVTRFSSWAALELPPGRQALVLVADTPAPRFCHSVWLFENGLELSPPR